MYDNAIADYTEAIRLDPNLASAYQGRGSATSIIGKGQPLNDLNEAIRLDSKNLVAYQCRAALYNVIGKWDAAIADCTTVLQIAPNDPDLLSARAMAYQGKKDFSKACADYREALAHGAQPKGMIYAQLASIELSRNNLDKASLYFEDAIQFDPANASVYRKGQKLIELKQRSP